MLKDKTVKHEGSKRILVVDDDPDTAVALRALFELEGYDVRVARNGRNAVQASLDDRPDVVVTDLAMPVMSGIDLIKAFKVNQGLAGVPIIAVSAEDESELDNAARLGAVAVYQKPLDFDRCLSTVASVVDRRKSRPSKRSTNPRISGRTEPNQRRSTEERSLF